MNTKIPLIVLFLATTVQAQPPAKTLTGAPQPAKKSEKGLEGAVDELLKSAGKEEAARKNVRDAVRELVQAAAAEEKDREPLLGSAADKLKAAGPDLPAVESSVAADLVLLGEKATVFAGGYYDRAEAPRLVLVHGYPSNGQLRSRLIEHGTNRAYQALAWKEADQFNSIGIFSKATDSGKVFLPRFTSLEELERAAHSWSKAGWTMEDMAYTEARTGWTLAFWMALPDTSWRKGLQTVYDDTVKGLASAHDAGWRVNRFFANSTKSPGNAEAVVILRKERAFKVLFSVAKDVNAALAKDIADGWTAWEFGYVGPANSAAWITREAADGTPEYSLVLGSESPAALAEALAPKLADARPYTIIDYFYHGTGSGMWLSCGNKVEPIFEENTADAIDIRLTRLAELAGNRLGGCKFEKLFHIGPGALALFLTEAK